MQKLSYLFYIIVIPVLVFLVWSMDAGAEESEGYLAPNGRSYKYYYEVTSHYGNNTVYNFKQWSDVQVFMFLTANGEYHIAYYSPKNSDFYDGYGGFAYDGENPFFSTLINCSSSELGSATVYQDYDLRQLHVSGIVLDSSTYPLFSSLEAGKSYYATGDDSGYLNKPPVDLEKNGAYDDSIPIPRLGIHDAKSSNSGFTELFFANGSEDLFVEVKGAIFCPADIEMYKDNLVWKFSYSSILKSNYDIWVSADEEYSSANYVNISTVARPTFDTFLQSYPVADRSIEGGFNSLNLPLLGRSGAVEILRDRMDEIDDAFNSYDIFARYYIKNEDGTYSYSRWSHIYTQYFRPNGDTEYNSYASDNGLTDEEIDYVQELPIPSMDTDTKINQGQAPSGTDASMADFTATLDTMSASVPKFMGLVSSVFGFLPWWCTAILGIGLGLLVVVRILGR